MKFSRPAYYETFACIAAACPDSCCQEWAVDVDAAAAAYYRGLPGPLGDRLRQVLQDTEDGAAMTIEDGRCPMWRQDGLCRIQAELGHDALCQTCREFPRLRHDYGDFLEQDLALSCPEAARLILTADDRPVTWETPEAGETDYDEEAMAILRASRGPILAYLQDPGCAPAQALAVLLLYGYDVQAALDGDELFPFDPDALLAETARYAGSGDMAAIFRFFQGLEILTPRWQAMLQAGPARRSWQPGILALARYLIRRYWYQAVSDYDLTGRVKFTVIACLLLSALPGSLAENAQLFSKEIENDSENVEAILDGAYRSPALTDQNLLRLLSEG